MKKEITDYLNSQNVGVLAVETMTGSIHAASMHYANGEDTFVFYFGTYSGSRKGEAILGKGEANASFVVGCDESNMKTLQMSGTVEVLKDEEKDRFEEVYFGKFPGKKEKSQGPQFLAFKFVPSWWRFTDMTQLQGKVVIHSTDI